MFGLVVCNEGLIINIVLVLVVKFLVISVVYSGMKVFVLVFS